jgi:hypothetical protein
MTHTKLEINFVIFSPFPEYVDYIGGATVPHTLAHKLSQLGENVYLYSNSTSTKYSNVTCIPWGTEIEFDPRNTIVIFIAGAGEHTFEHNIPNCLKQAPNKVRWLVNHQVKEYPEEDKFYVYHSYWDVLPQQRIDGKLSVIEVDHDLFQNKNLKREGVCYLEKGGLDTEAERAVHTNQDFCIDSHFYTIPNHEKMKFLANLFNQKELFISYTPFTFMSVLAALCGCKSIVIPKQEYNGSMFDKNFWRDTIWCAKYGLGVGLDELQYSEDTLAQVKPNVELYEQVTQRQELTQFVEDSYQWLLQKYEI